MEWKYVKQAIEGLQKARIGFFVYGGWALEGIRGQETRTHDDLDLCIWDKDWLKVREHFKDKGYRLEFSAYRQEITDRFSGFHVDMLRMRKASRGVTHERSTWAPAPRIARQGEKGITFYPAAAFEEQRLGGLGSIVFPILPYEALQYDAEHYDHAADIKFAQDLKVNADVMRQIFAVPPLEEFIKHKEKTRDKRGKLLSC
jgi:hypothetical protein